MLETYYVWLRVAAVEYEVADIFREYGYAYRALYSMSPGQARVMASIEACRTAALGGQIYECLNCGALQFSCHSCRDWHCPNCQKLERAQWVER